MANIEEHASRVRAVLAADTDLVERRMYRSLSYVVNGHPAMAISDGTDGHVLMIRVGTDDDSGEVHTAEGSTHRANHGWVYLAEDDIATDQQLAAWVCRAISFARTLPPK